MYFDFFSFMTCIVLPDLAIHDSFIHIYTLAIRCAIRYLLFWVEAMRIIMQYLSDNSSKYKTTCEEHNLMFIAYTDSAKHMS